jgi:hypothetical protein
MRDDGHADEADGVRELGEVGSHTAFDAWSIAPVSRRAPCW